MGHQYILIIDGYPNILIVSGPVTTSTSTLCAAIAMHVDFRGPRGHIASLSPSGAALGLASTAEQQRRHSVAVTCIECVTDCTNGFVLTTDYKIFPMQWRPRLDRIFEAFNKRESTRAAASRTSKLGSCMLAKLVGRQQMNIPVLRKRA